MRLAARRVARRLSQSGWMKPAPSSLAAINALGVLRARAGTLAQGAGLRKPPKVYGCIGDLQVCVAATRSDVRRAQRLRYEVFYEEMDARPSFLAEMRRRDEDRYDAICDHLLVVDAGGLGKSGEPRSAGDPKVVGTYRVLLQDIAEKGAGFYSQGEYDIAPLIAAMPDRRFVELGRSCVLKPYRTRRTVELLWHGLWTYVREHKADVMIGCASFTGTDAAEHAMALSYLHAHALAPEPWRARAHGDQYVAMDMIGRERLDAKAALKGMPPLIKAYLRLGAWVGDGAVVDRRFGTTDVLMVLPVERIDKRYFEHFGTPDETSSRVGLDA